MIKNLKRHKKNLEKEGKTEEALMFNFFPNTFHLPSEYPIFYEEFKKQSSVNDSKVLWIMKPVRNIYYLTHVDSQVAGEGHIPLQ
jgi:tubulin polyglutamylase TTLL9